MKIYNNIPIYDELQQGDCGLWYDVQAIVRGQLHHHVCPYDKCHTFKEAIQFYMDVFFDESHHIICVTHHKFSADTLKLMARAA
jgi:hypothetical protein